ncbi:MAG: ABC transporter ATP-binding protein, partial [Alphaproteobacteria bacterium]|nr:ABC transporter ATP-binding protein [Alphaproteobacteria bacterium]
MLNVEGLAVTFRTARGMLRAVDGVSLSVQAGRTLAL